MFLEKEIKNKTKAQITKILLNMHAVDIAKSFIELDEKDQEIIIELIPFDKVDDVFIELESDDALYFFNKLDSVRKRKLLTDLSTSDLKPLFENFDLEEQEKFLKLLPIDKSLELKQLLTYEDSDAASILEKDYINIYHNKTVGEAMRYIEENIKDSDYIDTIYVTKEDVLIGTIELKNLIIARKHENIIDLVDKNFEYILETDNISKAISKIKDYDLSAIPVLNYSNKLQGIITADDVLEEMASIHEAKIDKFLAMGEFKEASNPFQRAYQRLPWLLVSIVLNLLIALFLSKFSQTIEAVKALILFQPMILGMAGNIGTQAIAVTILAIHKKEHETDEDVKNHIIKEVLIGLVNSLLVGIFGFILAYAFLSISKFDAASNVSVFYLSLSIGLSLFLSMAISAFFGVIIPIILAKANIDPAAASGPVISTINDLVALLIYFGLATIIVVPLL